MTDKKPQIALDHNVYDLLKRYCGITGEKLSHVGSKVLRAFLETEHAKIESERQMIIEGEERDHMIVAGEEKKPRTIVEVLKEDEEWEWEEPRRSLKDMRSWRKATDT